MLLARLPHTTEVTSQLGYEILIKLEARDIARCCSLILMFCNGLIVS